MKCVIFCGGKGTRILEVAQNLPKPLLKVGDKTILERIMDHYASHGIKEFILCLGYAGEAIIEHFAKNPSPYRVEMIDTGIESNKAERLLAVKHLIDDTFCVSYGDDLSDVDISKELVLHRREGKVVTLTGVRLPNPYGVLEIDEFESNTVCGFKEKPIMSDWVNGGYFIFEKEIFNHIKKGKDLEKEIFEDLAREKNVAVYKHPGFWRSVNTPKDLLEMQKLFKVGELYIAGRMD